MPKHRMITRSRTRKDLAYRTAQAHHGCAIDGDFHREARMEKIETLVDLGCLQVRSAKAAGGNRLYQTTFVQRMRPHDTKRLRIFVAAYNDRSQGLLTAAPNIRQISICLLLSVANSKRFNVTVRDFTEAFAMTRIPLRHPFFMQPPRKMGLAKEKLLRYSGGVRNAGIPDALAQNLFRLPQTYCKRVADHAGPLLIILMKQKRS